MARDPYKILQLADHAEPEVIEAAYRRLARKYHPDLSSSVSANERMQDINWAYQILGDPTKRASYDQGIRPQAPPKPKPPPLKPKPKPPPPTVKTKPRAAASVKRPQSASDRERTRAVELFGLMIVLIFLLLFAWLIIYGLTN